MQTRRDPHLETRRRRDDGALAHAGGLDLELDEGQERERFAARQQDPPPD
jgi:hypothetical protein